MNRTPFVVSYLVLMALVPVFLAVNQDVPAGSVYKKVVLIASIAAFSLVLGQFWLSRLWPRSVVNVRPATVLHWHKIVGYSAGAFLLIHPLLMIARRFWVQESDPLDNLLLMLRAPALLPAIVGWLLLVLLILLSLVRRSLPPSFWRLFHGLMSAVFTGLATWHVVAVGRHSNAAMSLFWIVLAVSTVGVLLNSYLPVCSTKTSSVNKGVAHELAR